MERLEIRIDAQTRRYLEDWAHARQISMSEAVREIIRRQLGLRPGEQTREKAAQTLMNSRLTDVPGPSELEQEIHRAFGG